MQSKQELAHLPAGGVQGLTLLNFVLGGGMTERPQVQIKERDGKRVDPRLKILELHFILKYICYNEIIQLSTE